MTPLEFFYVPGEFLYEGILYLAEYPVEAVHPGVAKPASFVLSAISWLKAIDVVSTFVSRKLGIDKPERKQ